MRSFTAALAAALLLVPGPTLADEPSSATERARLHNATAKKLFNLGLFEQAAEEYMKAYQAKPTPEFLFNLGQCHKRITKRRNVEKAIFYFESYLQNRPNSPVRGEVEAEIRKLKLQLKVMPRESQPLYKKWWFWTIVGVVVTGATMGTVVALQPEDAKPFNADASFDLP
jgi:tetratricopeptide (TPR) repeat protein